MARERLRHARADADADDEPALRGADVGAELVAFVEAQQRGAVVATDARPDGAWGRSSSGASRTRRAPIIWYSASFGSSSGRDGPPLTRKPWALYSNCGAAGARGRVATRTTTTSSARAAAALVRADTAIAAACEIATSDALFALSSTCHPGCW